MRPSFYEHEVHAQAVLPKLHLTSFYSDLAIMFVLDRKALWSDKTAPSLVVPAALKSGQVRNRWR